jgi:hypothetical protein
MLIYILGGIAVLAAYLIAKYQESVKGLPFGTSFFKALIGMLGLAALVYKTFA